MMFLDKSSKSVKVNFKSPESSEKPNVNSKKEQETENARKALEVRNIRQEETKDRTESTSSTSSYYRDVRESLGNQNTSSPSGKNELLANIMAVENSEMAKALGLSEELIQLIKEEEQFWNRQVKTLSTDAYFKTNVTGCIRFNIRTHCKSLVGSVHTTQAFICG